MIHIDHHLGDPRRFTIINFLATLASGVVSAMIVLYLRAAGYGDQAIGWFLAIFPLLAILGTPLIGLASDVYGKRRILFYAAWAQIFALLMYLLGTSVILITLGRVLEGLAESTLTLISIAKAEDLIRGKRGERSGWILTVSHLAKIIAPPLVLLLAQLYALEISFWISLVVTSLILVLLLTTKEEHLVHHLPPELNYRQLVGDYWSNVRLRAQALIGAASYFSAPLTRGFLPLFIVEQLGMAPAAVALAYLAFDGPYLLQFYFGRLSDRFRPQERLLIPAFALSGLGFFALAVVDSFPVLLVILTTMSIFGAFVNVGIYHVLSDVGERRHTEGTVLSVFAGLSRVGNVVSAIIGGTIVALYGFGAYASLIGIVILVTGLGCWLMLKRNRILPA